ncbi:GntR family transcriptional regulator [Ancylobacter mangrovi]|uniref:GntR family transcriptional regulator n=1 Tax=Ancylobacter mangrovi TaxID=2972472 RepID=A0A9X2PD91_9HYPH|nr:GntR family transcriptional regulator [Ancylobacter mangrovi]MCS0495805.1 GntR family transcriptional regulator [Ancylobacter mangrovi]MCS0502755.1 GntR family transcriptional regulator [Ancylobacter mangrovi]
MKPQQLHSTRLEMGVAVGPQLYRLLRERIIRGDLPPGARISEAEIAVGYNVSRQPVREAFIKLAEESLVEVRPQRGTYVRRISVAAVMTARFIREAVEADIARQVAGASTEAALAALRRLIEQQKAIVQESDPAVFLRLDEAFHRTLAEAAGQVAVWDILQGLKTQMDRVRYLTARQLPRERLIDQHAAIVEAIAAGDQGAAEAAMRGHLQEIMTDLPLIARTEPEFFDAPAEGDAR